MIFKFIGKVVFDFFKTIILFITAYLFAMVCICVLLLGCFGVGYVCHWIPIPLLQKLYEKIPSPYYPASITVGVAICFGGWMIYLCIDYLIKTWKEMSLPK